MKSLYDVQKLLKRFGIFVYVGKRLWDIEVMALELDHLHDAKVITNQDFVNAKMVLTHEHRLEEKRENKKREKNKHEQLGGTNNDTQSR